MTVTTDSSAPLVVVVGATGLQGGSVIRHLIESDKAYRLRGLTRDAAKPVSLKLKEDGVEVVSVNIVVGNEAAVRAAFAGAEVVFGVTNFWEHFDMAREVVDGKLIVDAAKAVGVKLFVWSGLADISKKTGGKYTHLIHADGKAAVTAYARSQLPTADVQAGFYMTNLANLGLGPRKIDDGSYVWDHPTVASPTLVPYIDTAHDYGLFVRYAIENLAFRTGGGTIYTWGELISHAQAAEILARVRGVQVKLQPLSWEQYVEGAKAQGLPQHLIDDLHDFKFTEDFGYLFGNEEDPEQLKIRERLARRPRTFEEFLRAHPDFFAAP
ncbi:NAD(P)-binding protein [Auricularia subglabra TFB-10046 SS5]|uniref:NAD(P)-binding protein n=1 Tax=Auricularia subglabra (strain TFB-10046 / SS5) TaxID=717982 RepID=J0WSM4_AURST|nr:NAD(P)-binding protein [Auricularia subglabra TFB-10046 SS5]